VNYNIHVRTREQTVTRVNNLVTVLEQHSVQKIFRDKIIAYLGESGW